jgi:hypothetical protein
MNSLNVMTFFTRWQPHGCLQIDWFAVVLARYPAGMGIRGVVVSDGEVCRARAKHWALEFLGKRSRMDVFSID